MIGKLIRPTLAEKLACADVRATRHRIARTSCLHPQAEASPSPLASPPLRSCQYRALSISGPVRITPVRISDLACVHCPFVDLSTGTTRPAFTLSMLAVRLALKAPAGSWQQPDALHPPRTVTPALAGRWRSAALGRGDQRGRRQSCARLSRAADAWLCFRRRLKCLAQGFFLGVVKRRPQHLPANALKLRENLVWGNFADQKK